MICILMVQLKCYENGKCHFADDEMPERLADYMNTLVNEVIQTCAGLEPEILNVSLWKLEKRLKDSGKNLTY